MGTLAAGAMKKCGVKKAADHPKEGDNER